MTEAARPRKVAASAVRTHQQATYRIFGRMPPEPAEEVRLLNEKVQAAATGVLRVREAAATLPRLEELVAAYPKCGALVLFRGFMKRVANRFEEGITDLSAGIEALADEPQGYFWRATALGAQGRFAEAAADLDRAIAIAPRCDEYYKLRGQAREKLGLLHEAIADFDKTLECNKKFDWAFIGRSMCYTRLGRWQDAARDLDEAIKINPKEEWAYLKRSFVRRRLGDLKGAVADVNAACDLNPGCEWVIGKPPFHESELREAVAQLDKLLESDPGSAWARAWRGQTRLKLGEAALAEKDLSAALKSDLGQGRGRVLAWRGEAYRLLADFKRAEKDFAEAIKLLPGYPKAYQCRGAMKLDQKRPKEALEDLKRCAVISDRMPEVHFLIGQAFRALGRLPEAAKSYTEGLSIDPSDGEMLKARAQVKAELGDVSGQTADLCSHYSRIQISPRDWRKSYEELRAAAGAEAAERVWSRLPISPDVHAARVAETFEKGDAQAALAIADAALKTPGAGGAWLLHHWRGAALKKLGRLDESLVELRLALSLRDGSGRRRARTPAVLVDPRIEFLGALQLLIEPAPVPEACAKLAPEMTAYVRAAAQRFKEFQRDPAVGLVKAALQDPAEYRWFPAAKLLLGAAGFPELEGRTADATRASGAALLEALRALAGRMRFMEFFDAHRGDYAAWVSALAGAIGAEDFTSSVSGYLGVDLKADYALIVSPLMRKTSYSDMFVGLDGWSESRTVVCPLDREEALRSCVDSPSTEALWSKGWHELCHIEMDPWADAHGDAIEAYAKLYDRISGVARRQNWRDCFSEHLVLSPSVRLLAERRGAEAAKKLAITYKRNGYIYMDAVLEPLAEYEKDRARYPSLLAFYPRWLEALQGLSS